MTSQAPSYDDLWAHEWGDMQRLGPVHRHIREDLIRVVAGFPNCVSLLDVGCGAGDNLKALAGLGAYRLTGVDVSNAALDRERHSVPAARFLQLDVEREALPER